MLGELNNIAIRGIVSTVPQNVEKNDKYNDLLGEKRVKKQARITGIDERHIDEPFQTSADLCIEAAKCLLDNITWKREDIRVVVFITQYPVLMLPSTSFAIQKYLGISKECVVFDVNLGCSGYATGIHIVSSILKSFGEGAKGLLLAGETQRSPIFDQPKTYDEIADEMLFGSGGSATALEYSEEFNNTVLFEEFSEGDKYTSIIRRFNENNYMDGEAVFEYAINTVADYVTSFISNAKMEFDYYVFHQTQEFMLKNLATVCNIPQEKLLLSLKKYGNTSSASIPITISLHKDIVKGKTLFLCGFGVGLACAMIGLKLDMCEYIALNESNYHYNI